MKITKATFDSLYVNVIHTIIDLMTENNVKSVPVDNIKHFNKVWSELFIDEEGVLCYRSKQLTDYICKFNLDKDEWYYTIHKFDLTALLRRKFNVL